MIRAVMFDVDGTLIDSDEALVQVFTHSIRKFGFHPPAPEEILKFSGHRGGQWLRELLPRHHHKLIPQMAQYTTRLYATRFLPRYARPMPGVHATLAALRANGIHTAVITNMPRWVADGVLRKFGMEGSFEVIVSGEDTAAGKPSGLPLQVALRQLGMQNTDVLFVGDTDIDVKAARHAGVRSVLLGNGRNRGVLGAWRRILSLSDLVEIVYGENSRGR